MEGSLQPAIVSILRLIPLCYYQFGNHVCTHNTVYTVISGGYKICQWVVYDSCLSVLGYSTRTVVCSSQGNNTPLKIW